MATYTHRQSTGSSGGATLSLSPVQGNLLVVAAFERSGGDPTTWTISGSGWTKSVARNANGSDGTYRRALAVWWKEAGASEPDNVSVSGTSGTTAVTFTEISTDTDITWYMREAVSNDNGTTANATSLSLGTTGTISGGDKCLVGVFGIKRGATAELETISFATENLSTILEFRGGSNGRTIGLGFLQSNADATKTSTASFTSASNLNNGLIGALLAFSDSAGSGGGDPEGSLIAGKLTRGGLLLGGVLVR